MKKVRVDGWGATPPQREAVLEVTRGPVHVSQGAAARRPGLPWAQRDPTARPGSSKLGSASKIYPQPRGSEQMFSWGCHW